jgi:hypothetical protein
MAIRHWIDYYAAIATILAITAIDATPSAHYGIRH